MKNFDEFFTLQICQYIAGMIDLQRKYDHQMEPFSILIHGHPSSGKTTSLVTIADTLGHIIEQKSILPIYSSYRFQTIMIQLMRI